MAVVHMAIIRKVKPGLEEAFDKLLQGFASKSMNCGGVSGIHVLRPLPNSNSREYGILRSFESESDADAFYSSTLFREWNDAIEGLVEGEPIRRRLSGLEAFFREGSASMPPRWKMAIVTYLGVVPSVFAWSLVIPQVLQGLPEMLVFLCINAMVVASLTWVVMPALTTLFSKWLRKTSL